MDKMFVLVKTTFLPTDTYPGPTRQVILGASEDPEKLKSVVEPMNWYQPVDNDWCSDVVNEQVYTIESVQKF